MVHLLRRSVPKRLPLRLPPKVALRPTISPPAAARRMDPLVYLYLALLLVEIILVAMLLSLMMGTELDVAVVDLERTP